MRFGEGSFDCSRANASIPSVLINAKLQVGTQFGPMLMRTPRLCAQTFFSFLSASNVPRNS
jgi:hypothetical protein